MTLGHSTSISRYDVDERLRVETPTPLKGPLLFVSVDAKRNDSAKTMPVAPRKQRSIFSEYWKTDSRLSRFPPPSVSPIAVEEEKQEIVQRRRIIHNTYTYNYDRNPFQYFGIEEDERKTASTDDDENDSDSLNSYERILQRNEVGFSEMDRRRSTTNLSCIEGMVVAPPKTTQSDTVLFVKPTSSVQRLSCLRKSRFSFDTNSTDSNNGFIDKKMEGEGKRRPSVSFEANIKVHLFPPPVQEWAPNGWSNWFGGWH